MKNLEKAREQRLRRLAYKQGIRVEKSRIRNATYNNNGGYRLIDANRDILIDGLLYELTLADVESFLDMN